MPRGTATQVRSALRQVQGKARQVLKSLAQEIRPKSRNCDGFEMTRLNSPRSLDSEVLLLAGRSVAHLEKAQVEPIGELCWRNCLSSSRPRTSVLCL
jgi:hypothetical protein